jgi:hypothetical protein
MFLSVVHERAVETIDAYRERFEATIGATPRLTSDPYHRAVWTHVFCNAKGQPTKSDRPTWDFDAVTKRREPISVPWLFREIATADESFEYDFLYGAFGSDIVHSGPFSLGPTQRAMNRDSFTLQSLPIGQYCTIALAVSNSAMLLVLESLAEFLGLDLSNDLQPLKAHSKADVQPSSEEGDEL